MKNPSLATILFIVPILNASTAVIKNKFYKEKESYTSASTLITILDDMPFKNQTITQAIDQIEIATRTYQNNNNINDETRAVTEPINVDELSESQLDQEKMYFEIINQSTEQTPDTGSTTCIEETDNSQKIFAIQQKKDNNKISESTSEEFNLNNTMKKTETQKETSLANKYDYIKDKLKSALNEKLKIKESISRPKRQTQGGNHQTPSNHSPVYRASQTVSANNHKLNYYAQYQKTPERLTPVLYNKPKVVTHAPARIRDRKNNYPPNSGYPYPIDSNLAYSNTNSRYSTLNNANRRQFQQNRPQNRPPIATRRPTPRPSKTPKTKFRPLPVFA